MSDGLTAWLDTHRTGLTVGLGVTIVVAVGVAGTFVLGFGSEPACACTPIASFAFDTVDGDRETAVVVTHDGGEELPIDQVSVVVNGDSHQWRGNASGRYNNESAIRAGDSYRLTGLESGDTIRIVLVAEDGDSREVVGEHEVP